MISVGEYPARAHRRARVVDFFVDYLDASLSPERRIRLEDALDSDPTLTRYFDSYRQAIVLARETFRSRTLPDAYLRELLGFLRERNRR